MTTSPFSPTTLTTRAPDEASCDSSSSAAPTSIEQASAILTEFFGQKIKHRLSSTADSSDGMQAPAPTLTPQQVEAIKFLARARELALVQAEGTALWGATAELKSFYNKVAERMLRGAAEFPKFDFGSELRQWLRASPYPNEGACLSEVLVQDPQAQRARQVVERLHQVTGSKQRYALFRELEQNTKLPQSVRRYAGELAQKSAPPPPVSSAA